MLCFRFFLSDRGNETRLALDNRSGQELARGRIIIFFYERVHHNSFIGKKIACSYKAYGTTTATNATFSLVHQRKDEP
jgi:hypothetical protein